MNQQEADTLLILHELLLDDEIEEFKKMLSEYDWHYFQSDNEDTYRKGQYQWEKIKEKINNNLTFYIIYQFEAESKY